MARRKTVKPINLDKAIKEILDEYGDDVFDVLDSCVKEVADEATKKLHQVRHFAPEGSVSGEYSRSWVNEKQPTGRLTTKQVVHNEDHYRLTHLLEKGHVVKNGTQRVVGHAGAYPHIAPVNDWANQELPKMVERKIRQI